VNKCSTDAWDLAHWHHGRSGKGRYLPGYLGGGRRGYAHLRGSGELDRPRHNVKQTIERTDSGAELAEKHGLRLGQAYWTVGQIGSLGNVRTTTLRAYGEKRCRGYSRGSADPVRLYCSRTPSAPGLVD
jgi:hypothetical protein